tara:strand:+ start:631 stop:1116 length:486 start_codon:yes stop_codon:yes gene_type:complete
MNQIMDVFPSKSDHSTWMAQALKLAEQAYREGEIPVGALVVHNNKVIGKGFNQRERLKDPTAHAEILAITAASGALDDWRLSDCTLYVTKEPCSMCAGAIINSRIRLLVFGAYDEKKGCCGSLYQLCGDQRLDSNTAVQGGVEEERCFSLLREFFIRKART